MLNNEATHITACPYTEQRKRIWSEIIQAGRAQGWKPAARVTASLMVEESDRILEADAQSFAEYRAINRSGSRFALGLLEKKAVWSLIENFGSI